jgi:hypothetical protein
MSEVHIKDNESLDSALKRLNAAAPKPVSFLISGRRNIIRVQA